MLIVLSGLPGVGKTTIATQLARVTGAVHVRIDVIEQKLRDAGQEVFGEGYLLGHGIAEEHLREGFSVIADCVNPWPLTRDEWRDVADRAGVPVLEVEVVCSDAIEHRRRVESREADIPNHVLPTWEYVLERDYHPWGRDRLVLDSARLSVEESVQAIVKLLPGT
jgi:predicted kinase